MIMSTESQTTQDVKVTETQQVPPTNPMLSSATVPPAPTQLVQQPGQAGQQVAPEIKPELPTVAPAGSNDALKAIDTSDPTIKVAVSYIDNIATKAKLDTKRAIGHSLDTNDPRFIDEAYIRETIKDPAEAASVISMLQSIVEHQGSAAKQTVQDVHTQAGGKANWELAVSNYNKIASPADKEALSAALNSGNKQLINFAVRQVLDAAKEAGVVVQHNQLPFGSNTVEKGITRQEMSQRLMKRGLTDAEHEEIRRLRAIGMKQGI